MDPAAKSQGELACRFFADVEVLVKPPAGRAQNATFAPAEFDDFITAATRIRLGAALFGPQQRVSFRLQDHDYRPGAVIMRFVVETGWPIRHMSDQCVF